MKTTAKQTKPTALSENIVAVRQILGSEPEIEVVWKTEVDRRIEEIQSGKVKGVPAEEVSACIQKILKR